MQRLWRFNRIDYAEAHNNLWVTLREQGRSEEAEASYRQAMALKYDRTRGYLGIGLYISGDIDSGNES